MYNKCKALTAVSCSGKGKTRKQPWFNKDCRIAQIRYSRVKGSVNNKADSDDNLNRYAKLYKKVSARQRQILREKDKGVA